MKLKAWLTTLITLTASAGALAQTPAKCDSFLQAFTVWEDEIKGKIVEKDTLFNLVEWDPNSQYEGIVLTASASKTLRNPVLELEYQSKSGTKKKSEVFKNLKPYEFKPELLQFDDLHAVEFFNLREDGSYRVRLKSEKRVVCEQVFGFATDH